MQEPTGKGQPFLGHLLKNMRVGITYTDPQGTVLYANPAAVQRPTKTPRKVGTSLRDCHKETTNRKLERMFEEFRNGRREPHHYVTTMTGKREQVTIIPIFEGDEFIGCMSQIAPLEIEGPERTFE